MEDHSFFSILSYLPFDSHYACLKFLCKVGNGSSVVCPLSHPFFRFGFKHFLLCDAHQVGLPPLLALGLSHYIYGQPLDPMGIHFFHCAHSGERTVSHDATWDAFASIMKDVCFHVACEQTHILLPVTF
jgi:hypothetical protein